MKKLYLIIILIVFTSFQITKNEKLPNGFWRNVFFSERGYLNSSYGKNLYEIIEYKDPKAKIDTSIKRGFYIDDSLIINYSSYLGKRNTRYRPAYDVKGNFLTYLDYKIKNDSINYVPFTGLKSIFKYCNDTLVIQGEYRTLKFVKEKDQKIPIFIIPDSVYYPYNF